MKGKKMFISAILITTAMLLLGGCGNQAEPVSAEPAETGKETDAEESIESTSAPAAEPEESMESSEAEDNSEKEADTTEEESEQDLGYEIISFDDTVMYAAAECNIRSGAGTQYEKVGSLSYAQEVTVNGKVEADEDELWYVIKTEDGSTQMVSAGMLIETKPAVQTSSSGSGSGSSGNSGGGTPAPAPSETVESKETTESKPASAPVSTPVPVPATSAPVSTPAPEPVATPTPTPEPTPEPAPVHTHSWKEHYAEKQVWVPNVVWVPNIVVVEDYETQRVAVGSVYQCNCGFETTDYNTLDTHCWNHVYAGEMDNYQAIVQYEEQQVLVGTHEEDHGHQEDQGHYETSSYVDYYYCDCGERK